jgi:four helix bundle protein
MWFYFCGMRPHKQLILWTESILFIEEIYKVSLRFPDSERFGLTSQLRRASVSIAANIAEGAARFSKKEFLYFLSISAGSLSEVDTLLTIASRLGYIENMALEPFEKRLKTLSVMLNGLIRKTRENL